MDTVALPFLNPPADNLEGAGRKPTAEALSRRAQQRRQVQGMSGISYVIDGFLLVIYAQVGAIPPIIGPDFAGCGLLPVAFNIALSELGFTERFKDHYFVTPQVLVSMPIMLAFAYVAPEVG